MATIGEFTKDGDNFTGRIHTLTIDKNLSIEAVDVIDGLLVVNPRKRATMEETLSMPYFKPMRHLGLEDVKCRKFHGMDENRLETLEHVREASFQLLHRIAKRKRRRLPKHVKQ